MPVKRLKDPGFSDIPLKSHSFLEAFTANPSDVCFSELKSSVFLCLPSLWISEEEILSLAAPRKFALLNGDFSITQLDMSHVLIKLVNDLDYSRVFYHRSYFVSNCYMKLLHDHIIE
ncbi:hypothetical protein IEQ34_005677 [Dendrobium chrysotoxum]|uniref:Uncharacterized protein n=1 Tax=Dendrobium chrysotoxum TaxID=161865 RepID=A0AAV7HCX0_DENCH|nr:hypothetical protein IEQ34_005677 [Dendrobium chrysotoxum]